MGITCSLEGKGRVLSTSQGRWTWSSKGWGHRTLSRALQDQSCSLQSCSGEVEGLVEDRLGGEIVGGCGISPGRYSEDPNQGSGHEDENKCVNLRSEQQNTWDLLTHRHG